MQANMAAGNWTEKLRENKRGKITGPMAITVCGRHTFPSFRKDSTRVLSGLKNVTPHQHQHARTKTPEKSLKTVENQSPEKVTVELGCSLLGVHHL
jgi:hypothetical protein